MESGDVVFHPEASEEYAMALEWYARCGEHLGQSFEQEIERAVQREAYLASVGLRFDVGRNSGASPPQP